MAKLADAPDLGSGGAIHVGSTPIIRTFFELISRVVEELAVNAFFFPSLINFLIFNITTLHLWQQ